MTFQNASVQGLNCDCMPMTVCYIGKSVNLVTQQFCRKTSKSSKYGNVSGCSWSSIQRSASLSTYEQDQTHQRCLLHSWFQLDPATDYLPKPKLKQSGNHGSTTTHLPNTAKYLGVYINSKLSWNHHVDAITEKASSTLWFLNRNTAYCCHVVKEYCYQTYIRPQLEYASTVWSLISKSTSTSWRWSNEMQLGMSFRTSAITAAPLPWPRNFNGLAWNSVDSWLDLPWCTSGQFLPSNSDSMEPTPSLSSDCIKHWFFQRQDAGSCLLIAIYIGFYPFYLQLTVLHNDYDFTVSTPWCVHTSLWRKTSIGGRRFSGAYLLDDNTQTSISWRV